MDTESKVMRGAVIAGVSVVALVGFVATIAIVSINADAQSPRTPPAPYQPNSGADELGGDALVLTGNEHKADALDATPVERTKVLTVDNTAAVEVRYSATMRHLFARCVNKSTGVSLFIVEANAANTNEGVGPYCDTCIAGATLPPLGTAYLRTSAGTASVACGFVEDWPAGMSIGSAGGSGLSIGAADTRYLKLDASNDPVTGNLELGANVTFGDAAGDTVTSNAATWTLANDTNIAITGGVNGLSVDGSTFSVDGANNRVGIGTPTPAQPFEVSVDSAGGTMRSSNANTSGFSNLDFQMAGVQQLGMGYAGTTAVGVLNNVAYIYSRNGMVLGGGDVGFTFLSSSLVLDTGASTFNRENVDKDFIVDSDAEEAALHVDGQTLANLSLSADDDVDITTPTNVNVTATGNVIASGDVSQLSGATSAAILAVGSYVEAAADVTLSAANDVVVSALAAMKPGSADAITLGTLALQWSRGFFDDGTIAAPSVAVGVDDAGLSYSTASDLLALTNVGDVYIGTNAASASDLVVEVGGDILIDAGGSSGSTDADVTINANGATGNVAINTTSGGDTTITTDVLTFTASLARLPRLINTAPAKPTCDSSASGAVLYVDDTDDANRGIVCACMADSAGAYTWLGIDNLTACPGT